MNRFLINLDYRGNISWEEKTALFGAYLVDKGIQSSTLKSYISAIKHMLKQDGYLWDDNKALLCPLIKGCQLENDTVKVRLPIKRGLLEMLLFEINKFYNSPQPYLEAMYQALFCLAYYGMMRVGELTSGDHTVKACDVHVGDNKDKIQIVLYISKTHGKESRPQRIKITAIASQSKGFFCPVQTVLKYMKVRSDYINKKEQLFIFKDRSEVKPHQFRTMLRELLNNLGLDSSVYNVHSFRSGRTCDL